MLVNPLLPGVRRLTSDDTRRCRAQRLAQHCITFDADRLIDSFGGDVTKLDWPALRDVWLHVAHAAGRVAEWPSKLNSCPAEFTTV